MTTRLVVVPRPQVDPPARDESPFRRVRLLHDDTPDDATRAWLEAVERSFDRLDEYADAVLEGL